MLVRRVARPLLAVAVVNAGVEGLRDPSPRVAAARRLGLSQPELAARLDAGVQLSGGLLLAAGRMPRLAALLLAGSLLPSTLAGHRFWEERDRQAKRAQASRLLSDLGLVGGLLLAAADRPRKLRAARAPRRARPG